MNQLEKKSVKTITGRSGIFGIMMLMSSLFFVSTAMAQRTASVSGNWSNTATWGGQAVPTAAQTVTINSGITVTVDVNASCASMTFGAANAHGSTVTISGSNSLSIGGALAINQASNNNANVVA